MAAALTLFLMYFDCMYTRAPLCQKAGRGAARIERPGYFAVPQLSIRGNTRDNLIKTETIFWWCGHCVTCSVAVVYCLV
jgi:hypothetical protein